MKIIDIEKNKNNTVKKYNELICAKGHLSGTAQKMLAMVISMIRTDDTEFQKYALHIDSYKKEIGATNKEIEFYIKQAEELMRNPFRIDKKLFNWCSSVDWGSMQGYIIFDIHKDLKPYLLQSKANFTQYQLVNILHLKGKYSPRLYELFIMQWNEYKYYNKSAKSYTFDFKIDDLKAILGITRGYRYDNIKKQILEKAKSDFKKYTNIKFTYKEQKIGRKVDRVIVTVRENDKGSNDYLKDIKSFIAYMRKNFVNKDVIKSKDKYTNKELLISIKPDGHLYDKLTIKEIDKNRSKEMWEKLYEIAKQNELF